MSLFCCDLQRRNQIRGKPINGIDFIEVLDRAASSKAMRQRELRLVFVNAPAPPLDRGNIEILGGERIRGISVTSVVQNGNVLEIVVDQPGDFSPYVLRLRHGNDTLDPPPGVDPALAEITFTFKAECPSDLDCRTLAECEAAEIEPPDIDYLARDYQTFRTLMLDRISALSPDWRDRNPADSGVALVELLAYVGDRLSYRQDAIASEAYLDTARRRVSIRRHARLVDYVMHDGCNARTWVYIAVDADVTGPNPAIPKGTPFCTSLQGKAPALTNAVDARKAGVVFEAMEEVASLYQKHNELSFYTWGDDRCCLPVGAISATLAGHLPNLAAGQVLIFEEVIGPLTGDVSDADPKQRWAVRLATVRAFEDNTVPNPVTPLTDLATGDEITEISWMTEDALPIPLCLSARTDAAHGSRLVEGVSVARGNIVLTDHGLSEQDDRFPAVPEPSLFFPQDGDTCDPGERTPLRTRYALELASGPVSQAAPVDFSAPASRITSDDARAARPVLRLTDQNGDTWHAQLDLLGSRWSDLDFVAEVEIDGHTTVRFGDDHHGRFPDSGTTFVANYRIGNGNAGNIGRDTIAHAFIPGAAISAVRNPLPAGGGLDPESMEEVRQNAPYAFRVPMRAVTEPDYATIAERKSGIQRATARFRWTGSWYTVYLMADQFGGTAGPPTAEFEADLTSFVDPYRMAGYDLDVASPRYVSLEVGIEVCASPNVFRGDVRLNLLDVLSNRARSGGHRGFFHPDNFTFGQPVYLSAIYQAAQSVHGVDTVDIVRFGRMGSHDPNPLRDGVLPIAPIEIARLDNNPDFPERGVLTITVRGGK